MKARLVKFGEIELDKEGPGIRHPALHVLTGDLGRPNVSEGVAKFSLLLDSFSAVLMVS
jgi:hypothetical protein